MKHIFLTAALAGLVGAGGYAAAQDQSQPTSQATQTDSSAGSRSDPMEQCMARQKATNSGLTHLQMQTTCKNEIKPDKAHKEGNDLATGPQSGEKQQPQQ